MTLAAEGVCRWCGHPKRSCDAIRSEQRKGCPDCQHGQRTLRAVAG